MESTVQPAPSLCSQVQGTISHYRGMPCIKNKRIREGLSYGLEGTVDLVKMTGSLLRFSGGALVTLSGYPARCLGRIVSTVLHATTKIDRTVQKSYIVTIPTAVALDVLGNNILAYQAENRWDFLQKDSLPFICPIAALALVVGYTALVHFYIPRELRDHQRAITVGTAILMTARVVLQYNQIPLLAEPIMRKVIVSAGSILGATALRHHYYPIDQGYIGNTICSFTTLHTFDAIVPYPTLPFTELPYIIHILASFAVGFIGYSREGSRNLLELVVKEKGRPPPKKAFSLLFNIVFGPYLDRKASLHINEMLFPPKDKMSSSSLLQKIFSILTDKCFAELKVEQVLDKKVQLVYGYIQFVKELQGITETQNSFKKAFFLSSPDVSKRKEALIGLIKRGLQAKYEQKNRLFGWTLSTFKGWISAQSKEINTLICEMESACFGYPQRSEKQQEYMKEVCEIYLYYYLRFIAINDTEQLPEINLASENELFLDLYDILCSFYTGVVMPGDEASLVVAIPRALLRRILETKDSLIQNIISSKKTAPLDNHRDIDPFDEALFDNFDIIALGDDEEKAASPKSGAQIDGIRENEVSVEAQTVNVVSSANASNASESDNDYEHVLNE